MSNCRVCQLEKRARNEHPESIIPQLVMDAKIDKASLDKYMNTTIQKTAQDLFVLLCRELREKYNGQDHYTVTAENMSNQKHTWEASNEIVKEWMEFHGWRLTWTEYSADSTTYTLLLLC